MNRRPYLATSISEFWTRWHISLSTWFRDYVYIPLGGNRAGRWRMYRNLLIVFLVSGLWHGARWTFVVWGALHGFYTLAGLLTKNMRARLADTIGFGRLPALQTILNRLVVFVLVTFAWIFFRAENFHKASAVIHKLFAGDYSTNLMQLSAERGPLNLILSFGVIGLLAMSYKLPYDLKLKNSVLFLAVTTFIIIILGKNAGAEFIYFQF